LLDDQDINDIVEKTVITLKSKYLLRSCRSSSFYYSFHEGTVQRRYAKSYL